jgi:hypothetical protein
MHSPPVSKFVLIHGAWHGGFAWDGVASRLRLAGHEVEAPTLPGMHPGDNRVGIQFADYVDAVVDVLQRQHRPVISSATPVPACFCRLPPRLLPR